ncbi:hypothetical protein R3P38DRAFT_2769444 [Favolaschia claudopus]|uniref:Uncharacterized protein n=1 Tax=Favolaschia claudopus TaxID=2862362 RepID=A0AAW0CJX2_9AGAR
MSDYDDDQFTQGVDDNPESKYNDGRGIQYFVSFQPLPPPPQPNEKHRKNAAKPDTINHTMYAHEEESLRQVLNAAIEGLEYEGKLDFKVVSGKLRTKNFSVTWSIMRTDFNKMEFAPIDDYDGMVEAATEKAKPTVGPEEEGAGAENEGLASKKRKLTEDKHKMAETMAQLKATYSCADKKCSSPTCYLGNATGEHVCLTPIHLNTWAAAIGSLFLKYRCDIQEAIKGSQQ